jgi:hypothetical protein
MNLYIAPRIQTEFSATRCGDSLSQLGLCDLLNFYPVGINRSFSEKSSQVSLDSSLGSCLASREERTSRTDFDVNLVALLGFQELVISRRDKAKGRI